MINEESHSKNANVQRQSTMSRNHSIPVPPSLGEGSGLGFNLKLISGPCSAETEEQVMTTARQLAAFGCRIFRAGVWKPRTMPGGFEGKGEAALPWLQRVKQETGMKVATEVATPEHVRLALHYGIDILWIGARTTTNPFAMQDLADALRGHNLPVMIKNPVNPDIDLWIGAIERIHQTGISRIAAVHRGFTSYNRQMYRNIPLWQIPIELSRRMPHLPIFCDPSHIGGRRDLIAPIAQKAMDLGFDGLLIECHCCPDEAWSDAAQQITPAQLHDIITHLVVRDKHVEHEGLTPLRREIDDVDAQLMTLLSERMRICREIGQYKKQHNMTVVQTSRYNEMLDKRLAQAAERALSPDFIAKIYEIIHHESVRQQIDIINKPKRR